MTYQGKLTSELSPHELDGITQLFNNVFKRNINSIFLKDKYTSPCFGYSFHGLMYQDNRIVGALVLIPFEYLFFEKKVTFAYVADLMVHEDFRKDLLAVKKMYELALQKTNNCIDFVMAVPNDNAYNYWIRVIKWREIGQLYFYTHILKVSKLKPNFQHFNWLSGISSWLLNSLTVFSIFKKNSILKPIRKIANDKFHEYRFGKGYLKIKYKGKVAYYSIIDELDVKTAYIVDIDSYTSKSIGEVALSICRLHKKNIDMILYISNKFNNPLNLIRVPSAYEPRKLLLIGKAITGKVDERIYNIENWQFNLSNFDVR